MMASHPRTVVIHSLAHARAAAAAAAGLGVPVRLRSATAAAAYAGAGWFHEVVELARGEFPTAEIEASLDCGDAPGYALAALRQGLRLIRLRGPRRTVGKIEAIAAQYGAALDDDDGPVLDLLEIADPGAACRDWLAPRPAADL